MKRYRAIWICGAMTCLILMSGYSVTAFSPRGAVAATAPDTQSQKEVADAIASAHKSFSNGDYEQALALVDKAIEEGGETVDLLEFKDDVLWKLERHEARIANILRLEEIAERKSPWYCLKMAEAYLQLGRKDEALHWMEVAVNERGFRRADTFDLDVYDSIRPDPRFAAIVAKAHENVGIGRPVPDITIDLLDGGKLTLSALKGKVTLLDFWASWCVPCRKEVPNLKKLYKKFNGQGFEIVGISLDQDKAKALAYVDRNHLQWPISWSEGGYLDEPARLYMVNSLPSMWLIDKNGILRYFDVKGSDLRKCVELLLAEKGE